MKFDPLGTHLTGRLGLVFGMSDGVIAKNSIALVSIKKMDKID